MRKGAASECISYFQNDLGYKVPPFCNPATFLMKCMNPEGLLVQIMQEKNDFDLKFDEKIQTDFKERLKKMVNTYQNSDYFKNLMPPNETSIPFDRKINQSSWSAQFKEVLIRSFKNEIRNPMDIKTKFIATIIFSAICIIVFEGVIIFLETEIIIIISLVTIEEEYKIEVGRYFLLQCRIFSLQL